MKKVLVVDDTKNIRTLLTKCLQMEGYEVKTANDGQQAFEILLNEGFDLVFLDIKMPVFSGTEVLKKIRERGISTPVIIITAYATIKNAVECTKMGAVAYLQKPFTAEKVRNILAELQACISASTLHASDYQTIAEELMRANRFSEAFHYLRGISADKPLDAEVYHLLSKASEALGNKEDALKYMKISESLR